MPHQCTNCGRAFPDGSKEMLSGCPDCGGNKFQFRPESSFDDGEPAASGSSTSDSTPAEGSEPQADSAAPASDPKPTAEGSEPATAERSPPAEADAADGAPGPLDDEDGTEDRAQADARSEFVTPDELAVAADETGPETPSAEEATVEPDSAAGDPSDLDDLREELNDQFESIKIVNPGQYELNLMELYDREEYIISLREDGRYVIEVPETWRSTLDPEE